MKVILKKYQNLNLKKLKILNYINPDLLIGKDNSIIFFDEKGSILKFDQNSKLIWKKNYYNKKEIKTKSINLFCNR